MNNTFEQIHDTSTREPWPHAFTTGTTAAIWWSVGTGLVVLMHAALALLIVLGLSVIAEGPNAEQGFFWEVLALTAMVVVLKRWCLRRAWAHVASDADLSLNDQGQLSRFLPWPVLIPALIAILAPAGTAWFIAFSATPLPLRWATLTLIGAGVTAFTVRSLWINRGEGEHSLRGRIVTVAPTVGGCIWLGCGVVLASNQPGMTPDIAALWSGFVVVFVGFAMMFVRRPYRR